MRTDFLRSLRFLAVFLVCLEPFHCLASEQVRARAIVSLSPAATEWIYALGLNAELQGVTEQCDYPPEAKSHAKVGSFMSTSVERVLALRATDVVATQRLPAIISAKLRRADVRVHVFEPKRLQDFPLQIEALAKAFQVEEKGRELSGQFRALFGKMPQVAMGEKNSMKRSLVFVSAHPIYLASSGSWLSDLFHAAGFANALSSTTVDFPRVSFESLAELTADHWFVFRGSQKKDKASDEEYERLKKKLGARFAKTRIVPLPSDIFQRPGPRLVDAYRVLQKEVK
jgi:ABC-type hemin transport system substrate-binding protein